MHFALCTMLLPNTSAGDLTLDTWPGPDAEGNTEGSVADLSSLTLAGFQAVILKCLNARQNVWCKYVPRIIKLLGNCPLSISILELQINKILNLALILKLSVSSTRWDCWWALSRIPWNVLEEHQWTEPALLLGPVPGEDHLRGEVTILFPV